MRRGFDPSWAQKSYIIRIITTVVFAIIILVLVIVLFLVREEFITAIFTIVFYGLLIGLDVYFWIVLFNYYKYPEHHLGIHNAVVPDRTINVNYGNGMYNPNVAYQGNYNQNMYDNNMYNNNMYNNNMYQYGGIYNQGLQQVPPPVVEGIPMTADGAPAPNKNQVYSLNPADHRGSQGNSQIIPGANQLDVTDPDRSFSDKKFIARK